jgi:hypothetical protein
VFGRSNLTQRMSVLALFMNIDDFMANYTLGREMVGYRKCYSWRNLKKHAPIIKLRPWLNLHVPLWHILCSVRHTNSRDPVLNKLIHQSISQAISARKRTCSIITSMVSSSCMSNYALALPTRNSTAAGVSVSLTLSPS